MPYPLPLTRTEAYLAYKAGVIQQSDLKPSLAVPRNGIDAWLAYWTGLAADYPKREDGTPHILQEEEAYIAYLSGVINEYPEKCLRRVGAYLRYLISARWGRPDHPLNREELYLSLIKTQFIPSGDPSSDIEINGTAKAAFVDLKMYGDALQKTYTGSNLYLAKPYSNATQQGIKTTIKEGYIFECSGTATTTYSNIADWTNVSLPAGTYTFCIDHALTWDITMRLSFDPDTQDVTIGAGTTSKTVTVSSPIVAMRPFIATGGSGKVINYTMKLNIVAGSTPATVFEPYVGGASSPSPDYPQAIQTVTGLQTVTVSGKNIFDGQLEIGGWTINTGQTCEHATNNNAYRCINPIPVKPSSTYRLSVNGAGFDGFRAIFCDSNMTVLSSVVVNNTIVTPASCAYITFYSSALKTQFPSLSDIKTSQIEKGSAVTIYEPYSSNDYEINLGKNLYVPAFTNPNVTLTEDGFEMTTSQNNTNPSWSAFATLELKLNPWTEYTLSKKSYVVDGNEYNHSGGLRTYIEGVYSGEKDEDTLTFTTGVSGVVGLLFYTGYLDTTQGEIYTKVRFENVQIEAGPNATSYAPHFEPIELCKLGDYQDYIYKDGSDWKIHKATGKTTFTGDASEGWFRSGSTSETLFCAAKNINALTIPAALSVRQLSKMDRFTLHRTSPYGVGDFDIYNQSGNYANNILLSFDITKVADITAATTWISDNKPTLYYPIYTATDTIITNQALIDQLEALVKGGSEDGTTYIKVSATDPNLPGLLYVEAAEYV